eukprot:1071475-Amphidinium_carterae.2
MLYLQLPKYGVRNAGERRPNALFPQVYRLRSAAFLDCSKCYESMPLNKLEHWKRRILIQERSVMLSLEATFGLPPGCGHAVNFPLHVFLHCAKFCVAQEVHKYVDDMLLVDSGPHFAHDLSDPVKTVLRYLQWYSHYAESLAGLAGWTSSACKTDHS